MIALAVLREFKRITSEELARHLQKDTDQAKRTLEALHETGLVQAHGATKARSYTLSAGLYQAMGDKAALYPAGGLLFDPKRADGSQLRAPAWADQASRGNGVVQAFR